MAYVNEYLKYTDDASVPTAYILCRECARDYDGLKFNMVADDDEPCEDCDVTNEEYDETS